MRIGDIPLGDGAPLVLIAGLNVVEDEVATLEVAAHLGEIASRYDFPLIFKASVDKANRSSWRSYRGLGFDEGLRILALVKSRLEIPLLTDVHEPAQAKPVAEVADCLQIPAFLCRQTDLVAAAAATGSAVNIKKGQFLAPNEIRLVVEKVRRFGTERVLVTERGTTFGYGDLVVDYRALVAMRKIAPVCFDATHAVQRPGGAGDATGGDRSMVAPLARAAVAVGVDALFVEVHREPDRAPCDSESQLGLEAFSDLLREVRIIERAVRNT